MGVVSNYWKLVRLDATGTVRFETIAPAQTFFVADVQPHGLSRSDRLDQQIDRQIQHYLLQRCQDADGYLAECCLRCYVTHQIRWVCVQLETQFGQQHGFRCSDLFPFVLDDDGRCTPTSATGVYQSLATEIVRSFDVNQSSLNAWTIRRVRHHRELNRFLLECGVYLVSDWAILNDTKPAQLQRIFTEFHDRTPGEIHHAQALLHAYHSVYRHDRLQQRLRGAKGQCVPPMPEQLNRMAEELKTRTDRPLSPAQILGELQAIASDLRQYRIYVRGGKPPVDSFEQPTIATTVNQLQASRSTPDEAEQEEFLSLYRDLFVRCLDRSIQRVVSDRLQSLLSKTTPKAKEKGKIQAKQLLEALYLLHCQGQSMGDIAPQIGLQAQFQVTRLLKLKELRADVRQRLLQELCDRVQDQAKRYVDPDQLHALDDKIQAALDDQVTQLLQQAEAEVTTTRHQSLSSLFARRLCHHLDSRRPEL